MGMRLQQLLMRVERVLELVLDKHGGPDRRSENCEPLVCGGQVGVADPDVGPQRGRCLVARCRRHSTLGSYPGLGGW